MSLALTLQSGRHSRLTVGARDAITGQGVVHAAGRSLVAGAHSPYSSRPSSDSAQAELLRSLQSEAVITSPPWAATSPGLGATSRKGASVVATGALANPTPDLQGGIRSTSSSSRQQLSQTGQRPQGNHRGQIFESGDSLSHTTGGHNRGSVHEVHTQHFPGSQQCSSHPGGSGGGEHRHSGSTPSSAPHQARSSEIEVHNGANRRGSRRSLATDDRWAVPPWLPAPEPQTSQPSSGQPVSSTLASRGASATQTDGRRRSHRGGGGGPGRMAPQPGPPPCGGRAAHLTNVASDANSGYRAYMEDSAVIIDPYGTDERNGEQWGFYAVYDGHGGRQAVDYCQVKLHDVLLDELRSSKPWPGASLSDEAVAEALTRSFQRVDDQLRLVGAWRCGCTATVALLRRTPAALRLHLANVGDSRGVIVDASHVECRVSCDHRPTETSEVRRIEAEGGFVSRGRVAGMLGVSRALGDHALKNSGVAWRPHICARDATHDAALVIASDGLWDTVSDADARLVVERCMLEKAPEQAAQSLVKEAAQRGSMDNITCLVSYFAGAMCAS